MSDVEKEISAEEKQARIEKEKAEAFKKKQSDEVVSRFSFHKPDATGVEQMRMIRRKVRDLAHEIQALCPESREKATALTQLATVMMHANSAIVQQYPVDPEDV